LSLQRSGFTGSAFVRATSEVFRRTGTVAAAPSCGSIVYSLLFSQLDRAKPRKTGLAADVPLFFIVINNGRGTGVHPCDETGHRAPRVPDPSRFQIKFANNTARSPKHAGMKPNTLRDDQATGRMSGRVAADVQQEEPAPVSKMNGSCLCGSIRYACDAEPLLTAVCHCPRCQKQTGTSFSVLVAVPKGSLRIEGATLKTFDDVGESGLPVRRRFCGKCGSPIASYLEAMPTLAFVKAGTLENTSWLNPTMEVWCETAQPWIEIDLTREHADRNPPLAA
jgi:hypothetical protein